MTAALATIFDNQPTILSPDRAADLISSSRATIYDMNYRPAKYDIPKGMFLKNGRRLLIRTDILKDWFISRTGGKS